MAQDEIVNRLNEEQNGQEMASTAQAELLALLEKYKAEFNLIINLRQAAQSETDRILSLKNISEGYVKNTDDARLHAENNSSEINNLKTVAITNTQVISENVQNTEVAKTSAAKDVELIKKERDESQKVFDAIRANQASTKLIA